MNGKEKYIIITPVRDEEKYIEKTITSVIQQTIKPIEWVIVNDGSRDNTGPIIDNYVKQYEWIRAFHRADRGSRKAGNGVMEAFYDGYNALISDDWNFIVKLDGDLSFEDDYFQQCFDHFSNNSKLGVGGGMIYHVINGAMQLEQNPLFHVRGATKIYKRKCWDEINGLIKAPGWDTLDEVKANMLGWETQSFSDLKVIHHRYTGDADGQWRNAVKNGRASYISGYHPLFMLLRCLKGSMQRPYITGSLGLFYGYISGYINKIPQTGDEELINYLKTQQLKRIFGGKSIWK